MHDQRRPTPGIGIGRGRGLLKPLNNSNNVVNLPNFTLEKNETPSNIINGGVDAIFITCPHGNSDNENEVRPPRVSYVPNDESDDYRLHVDSGINFDKFDNVKVRVTGENIPPKIDNLMENIDIPQFLRENVCNLGFKRLTAVQKHTIPIIAALRDVMACAETGSGKTAAFLLPIIAAIERLESANGAQEGAQRTAPHAIILVPCRELCRQLFTVAKQLCRSTNLKCSYGYGGVEMNTSLSRLSNCHLLFMTPGRLLQYLNSDVIVLSRLSYFVLDEADRLLGVDGFRDVVQLVLHGARRLCSRNLHVSMFSATFPREIQQLAQNILAPDYLFVAVGIVGAANNDIVQTVLPVTAANKLQLTLDYITSHHNHSDSGNDNNIDNQDSNSLGKTLIFVRRKRLADFYGIRLIEMGLSTTTIHGDRLQIDREKALNDFKSGRVQVLVATDVAARGLDIPHVDTVINVDMPDDVNVYVHRIGRSGRCGNPGAAVTFFDIEEDYHQAPRLLQILRGSNQQCPDFLTQLGSSGSLGAAKDSHHKSSMRDLRKGLSSAVTRPSQTVVIPDNNGSFMNMKEEDEDSEPDYFD